MRTKKSWISPLSFILRCQEIETGNINGERGIALVLALLVITILCVMVIEFNYLMRVDITLAANVRDQNKAMYIRGNYRYKV